jgi:predicted MPP superfamily phosphohydrolase
LTENNEPDYVRNDFLFVSRAKIQKRASLLSVKLGLRRFHPKDFKISHLSVEIPNLGAPFRNYRIVHISDIHFGQWMFSERLAGVVELINGLEPDAVAMTGDFVSYFVDDSTLEMAKYLSMLTPCDVSVAVLGNHDHWAGAAAVREILAESNVYDISNGVYVVRRGDALLSFAGVDSAMLGKDRLDQVLRQMPAGPAVLLAHEPDFADKSSATERFNLQLSGHSHGGQFIIPGFGTPIKGKGFMEYQVGEYQVGSMVLYVNRGLGTNGYWLRINAPPEIAVITLREG